MDCLADLLSQKGMEGTLAWCDAGLKLRCRSSEETSSWVVLGHLPKEEGSGKTIASTSPQQAQRRAICKACTLKLQRCTQGLCSDTIGSVAADMWLQLPKALALQPRNQWLLVAICVANKSHEVAML